MATQDEARPTPDPPSRPWRSPSDWATPACRSSTSDRWRLTTAGDCAAIARRPRAGRGRFPTAWLRRPSMRAELERLLLDKAITPRTDDRRLRRRGRGRSPLRLARGPWLRRRARLERGFPAWSADATCPSSGCLATRSSSIPTGCASSRRRATGDLRRQRLRRPARQLRRARGVRRGAPARRRLPRHELARGPGHLEPTSPGGDRGHPARASASRPRRRSSSMAATRSATPTRSGPVAGPARSPPRGPRSSCATPA